ncbi:MAG: glycosyltransferase family 2 protein [Mycobacteriales bacterium]
MTAGSLGAAGPEPGVAGLQVVAVTYNSGAVLPRFFDSLALATAAPVELVVVDNASAVPPAVPAGAHLLPIGVNLGYGGAANVAAGRSRTPWLLVVNPDVVFHPGALDALLAAAEQWPRAGALGPAILTPDGRLYPSARALPSLGRGLGHALLGWWWPTNPGTASYRREREVPTQGPTGWLSGSCLLLRREAFDVVGGFDTSYFMYVEDLDLCERIAAGGWEVVYVPSAVVTHEGGHSTEQVARTMLRAHHDSLYRYLARRYPGLRVPLWLGLRARYLVSVVVTRVGAGAQPTRGADALTGR